MTDHIDPVSEPQRAIEWLGERRVRWQISEFLRRSGSATAHAIGKAIPGSGGSASDACRTLKGKGVLVAQSDAGSVRFSLDSRWREASRIAARRASTAVIGPGRRLIVVPANALATVWQLLAERRLDDEVDWAVEFQDSSWGLMLAMRADRDDAAQALRIRLQRLGIDSQLVTSGRALDVDELEPAALALLGEGASSLPAEAGP